MHEVARDSTENLAEQLAHAARDMNSRNIPQTLQQAVAFAVHLIEEILISTDLATEDRLDSAH